MAREIRKCHPPYTPVTGQGETGKKVLKTWKILEFQEWRLARFLQQHDRLFKPGLLGKWRLLDPYAFWNGWKLGALDPVHTRSTPECCWVLPSPLIGGVYYPKRKKIRSLDIRFTCEQTQRSQTFSININRPLKSIHQMLQMLLTRVWHCTVI